MNIQRSSRKESKAQSNKQLQKQIITLKKDIKQVLDTVNFVAAKTNVNTANINLLDQIQKRSQPFYTQLEGDVLKLRKELDIIKRLHEKNNPNDVKSSHENSSDEEEAVLSFLHNNHNKQ